MAEVLECARGTVKSRLSRALERLRGELGEEVA
jgi:DNA-directed RNA polymerase specialized sigma24 family protein